MEKEGLNIPFPEFKLKNSLVFTSKAEHVNKENGIPSKKEERTKSTIPLQELGKSNEEQRLEAVASVLYKMAIP